MSFKVNPHTKILIFSSYDGYMGFNRVKTLDPIFLPKDRLEKMERHGYVEYTCNVFPTLRKIMVLEKAIEPAMRPRLASRKRNTYASVLWYFSNK